MAEGARLESVYTGNRIVGSNPTPSASGPVRSGSLATAFIHISNCFGQSENKGWADDFVAAVRLVRG